MPKKPQKHTSRPKSVRPSARPSVQLRWLAHARSGDKGDTANVGLIALEPEYYPVLKREVTVPRVAKHFKGMVTGVEPVLTVMVAATVAVM